MHWDGADWVIPPPPFHEIDPEWHDDTGNKTDPQRSARGNPVAGARDGDQPAEESIDRHAEVPFAESRVDEADRREAGGAGSQRRVHRDPPDPAEVHGREGRAGVEPVPAEPQDHAAEGADGEVVGREWTAAVPLERSAQAGPESDAAGQGDDSADGVHHGGAGEVTENRAAHEILEDAHGVAQPAARTPDPMAEDRVQEAGDGGAVEDVALESGTADHGPRRDGRGGVGEGELEQPEGHEGDPGGAVGLRRTMQEEVLVPDKPVAGAELESEADHEVEDTAEAGVEHALHEDVDGLS